MIERLFPEEQWRARCDICSWTIIRSEFRMAENELNEHFYKYGHWSEPRKTGVEKRLIKVRASQQPTQDTISLFIVRYDFQLDGDAKQYFVEEMTWKPYKGFDILPLHNVTWPGNTEIKFS